MRTRGAERAAPPPSGVALHQHAASLTALASLLGYLEFAPCIPGGEGGMGAEIRKLCPDAMVSVFAPIHIKATLSMRSPIMWRGSQLHALFKNSGSPAVLSNCRNYAGGSIW